MKIFIDVRGPRRGGSWTYTKCLLPEIIKQGKEHSFTVLYDPFQEKFNLPGAKEEVLQISSKVRWLLWSHFSLPRRLDKDGFDIYHSFKQLCSFKSKAKRIYTFHTAGPFVYPEFYKKLESLHWRYMFKKSAKNSEAVIVCSEFDRKTFAEKAGIALEKIKVTHLAAGERFVPIKDVVRLSNIKQKYNLPEKFILFVGTLYPFKNVVSLIKAFNVLVKEKLGFNLVIAGSYGWFFKDIFDVVENLGLKNRVFFKEQIESEDLPEIYNMAEIFVFPSLYESFGLPPLEAMACGTPVIVSNRGALPEIAGNGALIINPDNTEDFADKMMKVLTDIELNKGLRAAGPKRAEDFSWQKCACEVLKIYEEV